VTLCRILNDITPMPSARNYRTIIIQRLGEGERKLSATFLRWFFRRQCVRRGKNRVEGECVHWVSDASICEHLEVHAALIQAQRGKFLLQKWQLETGQLGEDTILILQDFTQLRTVKGGFFQDL
jgi:hypothetical protein